MIRLALLFGAFGVLTAVLWIEYPPSFHAFLTIVKCVQLKISLFGISPSVAANVSHASPMNYQALAEISFSQTQPPAVVSPAEFMEAIPQLNQQWKDIMPLSRHASTKVVSANGVPAMIIQRPGAGEGVLFYLHGGGYVFGTADVAAGPADHFASQWGLGTAMVVEMRTVPNTTIDGMIQDTVHAYEWLLEQQYSGGILMAGDSAGAGLAVQALAVLHGQLPQHQLPDGMLLISPWVYPSVGTRTQSTINNKYRDPFVRAQMIHANAQILVDAHTGTSMGEDGSNVEDEDPDFPRLPGTLQASNLLSSSVSLEHMRRIPTFITTGAMEIMLDQIVRFHQRLQRLDFPSKLLVREHMGHVHLHCYGLEIEEVQEDLESIGNWLAQVFTEDEQLALDH